ncbi:MAG: recombinase family protein, partial [Oscillospiraceae bacterium]|nr:recombinase family protein [Oscillospiraceae bacterium]
RQAEGIAAARAKGVRLGRPPQARPQAFPYLCQAWENREISARFAARQLGVSPRTFLVWARKGIG